MEHKSNILVQCLGRLRNTSFSKFIYSFHFKIISEFQKFTKLRQKFLYILHLISPNVNIIQSDY